MSAQVTTSGAFPDIAMPDAALPDAPVPHATGWTTQAMGGHMYLVSPDGTQRIGADPAMVAINPLASSAQALVPTLLSGSATTAQLAQAVAYLITR